MKSFEVTPLGPSIEGSKLIDAMSYRVKTEGAQCVVFEVRLTSGVFEGHDPEERIKRWLKKHYATRPLPAPNKVINIPSLCDIE